MRRVIVIILILGLFPSLSWADTAWFVAPYKRLSDPRRVVRYCAMDDFTAQIQADGGTWREVEGLGNRCIVKVQAAAGTLTTINAAPGFIRVPLTALSASLSSLNAAQRTALKQLLLDGGFTLSELTTAFPDLTQATLGDVLRYAVSRRKLPRYDSATDSIVFDGSDVPGGSLDRVDEVVP